MSGLTENHPLEPFLPGNAILLMLGSFPPQKKRWSMDFFYPNWSNDMWRIFGLVFFNQKDYFVVPDKKAFDKERIIEFLKEKGIALYDTACVVKRLQNNASDKFLEIVEPTDIGLLLKQLPKPSVGSKSGFEYEDRRLHLYRMPSSSRAYPLKLEKKAETYRIMFEEIGLL